MYKYIASLHASVAMLLVANLTLSNSMTSTDTRTMPVSVRTAISVSFNCTPSSTLLLHRARNIARAFVTTLVDESEAWA